MQSIENYASRLSELLKSFDWSPVEALGQEMWDCWVNNRQVFICGNGGSAANAMHLANDFIYGIGKSIGSGLRIHALPSNPSVLTCLANDEGYDSIFSHQLLVQSNPGDLLIALSGSGNSGNILEALKCAKKRNLVSCAILGYSGGGAKELADIPIHFPIDDMQISEDLQLVVGHMVMQLLFARNKE